MIVEISSTVTVVKYCPTTSSPQIAMSKDRDIGRPSSPWSSYSQQFQNSGGSQAQLTVSTEANYQGRALLSAQPTSSSALPSRPDLPTRSSTDPSRAYSSNNPLSFSNSRSEDLNHQRSSPIDILSSSPRPLAQLHSSAATNSRPSTPGTSKQSREMSSSSHSDHTPHSELSSNSKLPSTSSSTAASIAYTYVFYILPSFLQTSGSHSHHF